MLAAIPVCLMKSKNSFKVVQDSKLPDLPIIVTHCCSSSSNGVTWGDTIHAFNSYVAIDSFDKAVMKPKLTPHVNQRLYEWSFKLKSEIPSNALYFLSKVVGSKKTKADVKELRDYV